MADSKDLTYDDVAAHNTKKDLYVVIHDQVYNASSFVDEHPGGEEVLLDVGGQDATEAYEDVGHSDEAREILTGMLVGPLKRREGDPKPKDVGGKSASAAGGAPYGGSSDGGGLGVVAYAALLLGAAAAYGAYQYLQAGSKRK